MAQLKLFDIELPQKPVNVATVPQRSPFRYPGGKTWFVPYARRWLSQYKGRVHYIEAFAGGSIIGLTAAFENLAQSVLLVEIDPDIAAVWKTILSGNGKWLAKKMLSFEVTPENVANELSKPINSVYQRGFITLLKNRLHHGGILADGAGLLKNGENGKGLLSRWYPKTIYKRILDILEVKDKIQFLEEDGLGVIKKNFYNNKCVFFVDPPYTKAAKRLYTYFEINHEKLFKLLEGVKGDFLLTYDDTDEIERLAKHHHFDVEKVIMKTTLHYTKYELVIGRNLSWLRSMLNR